MVEKIKKIRKISGRYMPRFLMKKSAQKSSIQMQLLSRLVIAGVILSITLATAVFIIEFQRLGRLVNDRASEIVVSFNNQVRHMLDTQGEIDQSALQQELKMLLIAGKSRQWMGQLVYSSIYDLEGREMVTEIDTQYAHMAAVEDLVQSLTHRLPKDSESEHKLKRIKGVPYIQLTFPLTSSIGKHVAVVEGIFAVSASARDEVLGRIMRSVFGAIGIVLLTTLILYPVIVTLIRQLSILTENLLESNIETLRVIGSAIAKRDSDTDSHNYRVTIYSVTLAETVGLKPSLIQGLIKGAFLHDVGKIGISDQILLKPGKLSESEFEVMKNHVNHGIDIVKRSEWLKDATDVVGYHHEKFAGEGYPYGFIGSQIPVNARIFAIADVFDALISDRPYKKQMSFERAMGILNQGRGNHFDPFHLDTFNTISRSLYDKFAHCSEQKLQKKMESIIQEYFSSEYRFNAEKEA